MVKVVCALIFKDNKILITQRSKSMSNPLKWEFPGGKIQDDESIFNAIQRECKEEMGIQVDTLKIGKSIIHSYPHISIELIPVFCSDKNQHIQLTEHIDFRYITPEELKCIDFSQADIKIIEANNLS